MEKQTIQIKLILFSFLFVTLTAFSQEDKAMNMQIKLSGCNVINPQIYKAIDSVIFYASDCVFSVIDKPYYYSVLLWSANHIEISVLPYNISELYYWLYDLRNKQIGLSYYKDKPLLVSDRAGLFSHFFQTTDTLMFLQYESSKNLLDQSIISAQKTTIHYTYQNGYLFIEDEEDIESCNTVPRYPYRFIYMVKENDTKESIAATCGCTVEDLFHGYPPPIEGFLIIAHYHVENGRLVNVTRVQ